MIKRGQTRWTNSGLMIREYLLLAGNRIRRPFSYDSVIRESWRDLPRTAGSIRGLPGVFVVPGQVGLAVTRSEAGILLLRRMSRTKECTGQWNISSFLSPRNWAQAMTAKSWAIPSGDSAGPKA